MQFLQKEPLILVTIILRMSFAKVQSAQVTLLDASIIDVEVDLSGGLHAFSIVGLPDKAIEEAKDRVSSAIKNTGFKSPKAKNQKTVVSLAPADIRKEGTHFDLAIALGYLLASKNISFKPDARLFLGELALNGKMRPITGVLPLVKRAKATGFTEIFVPPENAREAALIDGITVYPVQNLTEVIAHLIPKTLEKDIEKNIPYIEKRSLSAQPKTEVVFSVHESSIDLSDIKGQESAKRGLEIAAAGAHNIAMYGPPGTGKTMLARAFAALLPPLSFDEALEVTAIHSVAGVLKEDLVTAPPFRSPHHTASHISIAGGGTIPKPGEITLSHRGVLFLDEFPEFEHRVIEGLRQPLEDRTISITRVKGSASFPAQFILIAAMNPCPCGNYGSRRECICTPQQLIKYRRKISGPIVDRIDMWVEVSNVEYKTLAGEGRRGATSTLVREKIAKARKKQEERFKKVGLLHKTNSEFSAREIDAHIKLPLELRELLNQSAAKLNLSGRAYHRVLKLARTIADLEGSEDITQSHLMEALSYRPKATLG